MKFKINNEEWEIKEVTQEEMWEETGKQREDGYFFGKSLYYKQEIWLDKEIPECKKRKTLIHELTHVYMNSCITHEELNFTEETACDLCANSHDFIHEVIEKYFDLKKMKEFEKQLTNDAEVI